jgi:hypothetical protein
MSVSTLCSFEHKDRTASLLVHTKQAYIHQSSVTTDF